MDRKTKHAIPLLLLIVLLVGVLYVFHTYPALLETVRSYLPTDGTVDEPDEPGTPTAPDVPTTPDEPSMPTDPTVPDTPDVPTDPTVPSTPDTPDTPDEPEQPVTPAAIVSLEGTRYTYREMVDDLTALAEQYGDILHVDTYGSSADGRALYVATLGNIDAPRQIIITSGMHAREYVNCYVVMRQMEHYLRNYDTAIYAGKTYRELFSEISLVIAPMTNPDGITLAQEGLSAIRSATLRTRLEQMARAVVGAGDVDAYFNREWKANARGVDINRNFDALWSEHIDGVGRPGYKNYKGEMPGSEVETAALVRMTQALSDPIASLCVHMQGEVIYWRCNQEGAFEAENRRLAEIAASVTGYRIIDTNETEPSYSNWTILEHEIPTITVETGVSRYPLSYTLADGILQRNLHLWSAVAYEYATK